MFRLITSLGRSFRRAIATDAEVQQLVQRHPRLFGFLGRRLTPNEKFGLHLTVGVGLTLVFLWFFFGLLGEVIGRESLIQADLRLINLVQILRTPSFNRLMAAVTAFGDWPIILAGVVAVSLPLLAAKRWYVCLAVFLGVGGGAVFVSISKLLVARARPSLLNAIVPESSFSFPSGHSFLAITFYGLLAYFVFRAAQSRLLKAASVAAGTLLVAAIGFSRFYLGTHWPSDILAGYASGAAWLTSLITALEIRKRFGLPEEGTTQRPTVRFRWFRIGLLLVWAVFIGWFIQSHPLPTRQPVIAERLDISHQMIPDALFLSFPKTSEDITGRPMEPMNIIIVGTPERLGASLRQAGWIASDPIRVSSLWRMVTAALGNRHYPEAPGAPAFWNGQPNDLSYAEPADTKNSVERHHLHLWSTPWLVDGTQSVWVGTAHYDRALTTKSGLRLPIHSIDPAVDVERDRIKDGLEATGNFGDIREFAIVPPTLGQNQTGEQFFTDGKAYVFFQQ